MQLVDKPNSTFTTPELTRLTAYWRAVAAGFYSDWDGSATCTDSQVLASLLRADGASDGGTYPFTREERERLAQLRQTLAAGGYTDDQPAESKSATTDESAR